MFRHLKAALPAALALTLVFCGPALRGRKGITRPKLHQDASDGVLTPTAAAKFLEGEIALQHGDFEAAVDAYATALAMDRDNPFLMTSLALACWRAGKGVKAKELLKEVLKKNPDYDFALNVSGKIHREAGNTPQAEAFFKKAMEAAPDGEEGYLNLIDLYKSTENLEAAFQTAEKLIERIPDLPEGYGESAELAFSLGMIEKSHTRTLQYIEAVPAREKENRYRFLLKQGKGMLEEGRAAYALFLLNTYREIFPNDTHAIEALVSALAKLGKTAEARLVAGELKDEALWLKAQLLYETGALGPALDIAETLFPETEGADHPPFVKVIKTVGLGCGMNIEGAKKSLSLFQKEEGDWRAEALSKLLLLFLSSGMEEEARSLLLSDPAAKSAMENFEVFHAVACEMAGGRWEGGEEEIAGAFQGRPLGNLLYHWGLFLGEKEGGAVWLQDNIDEAIASAGSVKLKKTARIVKAILVGEKVIKANQTELLDLIVKIKKDDPESRMIPALQARFFLLIGNTQRAGIWFQKAEIENPADFITELWHAEFLIKKNELPKAQKKLAWAIQLKAPLYFTRRILGLM